MIRFHGDGSGSGSELSQWKQTAAPIHHHSNHAGHTGRWDVRTWGGTCRPGLPAFLLLTIPRPVSEATSEGQSWRSCGHAGSFLAS